MITKGYLPISDNKDHPLLKRGVRWFRFTIDKDEKFIIVLTKLSFFEPDEKEQDGYGKKLKLDFERKLQASNTRTVNEIGQVVTQNENNDWVDINNNIAKSIIGQFDFFEYLAINQPLQVYPFIDSIVLQEDSLHQTYDEFNPYE